MQYSGSIPGNKETVVVGLCFMQRKLKTRRNKQVYDRVKCKEIALVQLWPYFGSHWSTWPIVDVFFQSYTIEFPYVMAREYVQKHKPLLINDIENEQLLWDRTVTYRALTDIGVPVPSYCPLYLHQDHVERLEKACYGQIFNTDGKIVPYEDYVKNNDQSPSLFRYLYNSEQKKFDNQSFTEDSNSIHILSRGCEFNLHKPFIEKPSDSNDHKVSLYYQKGIGGGYRSLYRQNHGYTSSVKSHYQKDHCQIRKDQNYIYEEFIGTNIFDIKIYTVGSFIFAESRRSPMVDVEKDCMSSQLRHEVELTEEEREYCRRIVDKFKLPVCGLDILRSEGKSYVCDVNGWAFAKGGSLNQQSSLYWDLLAQLLRNMVFEKFFPEKPKKCVYRSLGHFKEKCLFKNHSQSPPCKDQQLKYIIQIVFERAAKNQKHMTAMGEQIRLKSYDNEDCLGLFSTFENSLKVECICSEIDPIFIGHLLKGYLGIKGEVSPPIISMIKVSTRNSDKNFLQTFEGITKVLKGFQGFQKETTHTKKPKLKTFIWLVSNDFFEEINCILDHNHKLSTEKHQQKLLQTHISRVQLKVYEKYDSYVEGLQSQQIEPQKRVQVRIFSVMDVQRHQSQDRIKQINLNQAQFIHLLSK